MEDRPAFIDEIEITPEMVRAGALAGWQEPNPPLICERIARDVYRAMEAKRRETLRR